MFRNTLFAVEQTERTNYAVIRTATSAGGCIAISLPACAFVQPANHRGMFGYIVVQMLRGSCVQNVRGTDMA